jgi:hypothetical protein
LLESDLEKFFLFEVNVIEGKVFEEWLNQKELFISSFLFNKTQTNNFSRIFFGGTFLKFLFDFEKLKWN